jgi:hypothetical protein
VQASDATLTKEELEEREAARLAALEAARLKRMRADAAAAAGAGEDGDGDADDFEDDDAAAAAAAELPKGGYAAKRARAKLEAEKEERRQRRKLDASGASRGIACGFFGTSHFLCNLLACLRGDSKKVAAHVQYKSSTLADHS